MQSNLSVSTNGVGKIVDEMHIRKSTFTNILCGSIPMYCVAQSSLKYVCMKSSKSLCCMSPLKAKNVVCPKLEIEVDFQPAAS